MMNRPASLAMAAAMLLAWAGAADAQMVTPVQYPPPPGYGPPPGYPPPPPGYGRPDYPPEHRMGFRCHAEIRTPRGPHGIICPLDEPRPVGRRCECPPPEPPPGYPPPPPAFGRVIR
jgi:hypothetical protein